MLKAALYSIQARKGEVAIIDFAGEFTYMAEKLSLSVIDTDEKLYTYFTELLPEFKERNQRKKKNIQSGMSDEDIYLDMYQQYNAKFILIANLADFITHVDNPKDGVLEMRPFVENILDKGSLHNVYWLACYNYDDVSKVAGIRMYEYFLRYKTGIHFGGNVASQRIMNFDYVPYSEQTKSLKPGIGMIPENEDDDVRKVIVPIVKG